MLKCCISLHVLEIDSKNVTDLFKNLVKLFAGFSEKYNFCFISEINLLNTAMEC